MKMYTPGEFAVLIGKSVKTLQRWDRTGHLVAQRTDGNRRRYSHSQLLEFYDRLTEEKLSILFQIGDSLSDVSVNVDKVFRGEILNIVYVIDLIVLSRVKHLIVKGEMNKALKDVIVRLCALHNVKIDIEEF